MIATDAITEARATLEERTKDTTERTRAGGHDLHPWSNHPDGSLAKRTACRSCGRRVTIRVIPRGTFTQAEVQISPWVGLSVPCRK